MWRRRWSWWSLTTTQVVEVHLELTPQMKEVQVAVLDLITFTVSEVRGAGVQVQVQVLEPPRR